MICNLSEYWLLVRYGYIIWVLPVHSKMLHIIYGTYIHTPGLVDLITYQHGIIHHVFFFQFFLVNWYWYIRDLRQKTFESELREKSSIKKKHEKNRIMYQEFPTLGCPPKWCRFSAQSESQFSDFLGRFQVLTGKGGRVVGAAEGKR